MNLEQCMPGCCVCSLSSWPIASRVPSLFLLVSFPVSTVGVRWGMWEVCKAQLCILIPVQMLVILRTWIQVFFPSCGRRVKKMMNYLALVLPLEVESVFDIY